MTYVTLNTRAVFNYIKSLTSQLLLLLVDNSSFGFGHKNWAPSRGQDKNTGFTRLHPQGQGLLPPCPALRAALSTPRGPSSPPPA